MALAKRDWLFVMVIAVVLGVLLFGTTRERPKSVPADDRHRQLLERVAKGEKREMVEKECVPCHSPQQKPLSAKHPPKEQCLICHLGGR